MTPLEARFWAKVQASSPDQCWPWTGYVRSDSGHGAYLRQGRLPLQLRGRLAMTDTNRSSDQKLCPEWPEQTLRERLIACRIMLYQHGVLSDREKNSADRRLDKKFPMSVEELRDKDCARDERWMEGRR